MERKTILSVIAVSFLTLAPQLASVSDAQRSKGKKDRETKTARAGKADKGDKSKAPAQPVDPAKVFEKIDRKKLSAFLVDDADKALKQRKYGLAVSLYRGVAAIRGEDDPIMWEVAKAWQLAGDQGAAADELERYRDAVKIGDEKAKANQKISELRSRVGSFDGTVVQPQPAVREALQAFRLGRRAFKKKDYAEAILLYKAGYAMAPDLPGNLRELGEAYDKLGLTAAANEFFVRYLRMRPFGKNADRVRERLAEAGVVGKLSIESSLPCDQVWLNRQPVPAKLPIKDLVVAPGYYKALCYSGRYHFARYRDTKVEKGEKERLTFHWAILENKLNPWGRIWIEDPDDANRTIYAGSPQFQAFGIPVPDDRRALKVRIEAGDGSKDDERLIRIEPGKRIPIEW